jgi:predicted small metal-binding protein
MKSLSCKDMGAMDCEFVATGDTVEEVKQKMMAHAQEAHADVLANLSPEEMDEKNKMMEAMVKDEEPTA